MGEREGVIKFDLSFTEASLGTIDVAEMSVWRGVLRALGLIGREPERYGGLGFGNLSTRTAEGFIVSGTQTGGLAVTTADDYALVEGWDLSRNSVTARGRTKPSSESLTHAAIYDARDTVNCVVHVHSPELWRSAEALEIAVTDRAILHGTPDMAREVTRRIEGMELPGIVSMGGHEEGILAFGRTLGETGVHLIAKLVAARLL